MYLTLALNCCRRGAGSHLCLYSYWDIRVAVAREFGEDDRFSNTSGCFPGYGFRL
jgi:hypothetical protein